MTLRRTRKAPPADGVCFFSGAAVDSGVRLPLVNHTVNLSIKGKTHPVTCIDLFDGGYGYYFDAVFSKKTRYKFSVGEQCGIPELGEKCVADFVSYPTGEAWKVRFLIPKWS